jgi:serine/threonine protein kinase
MDDQSLTNQQASFDNINPDGGKTGRIYNLGDKLNGIYEIFSIKEGGLGLVYLVRDVITNYKYAVKTLKSSSSFSKDQLRSEIIFLLETGRHPNIVKVFFVDNIQNTPHLFMEYVAGGTLRDIINNIGVLDSIKFAYQICLGMESMNKQAEIVHGDLKPENILISAKKNAKISDFSLSQQLHPSSGVYFREKSGTLPYMSPEQINGDVLDTRSDIFSFGVLFYEMLVKQLPYPFETKGLTSITWRDNLASLYSENYWTMDDYRHTFWKDMGSDITDDLRSIVIPCIFPNPHNRFWSFHELKKRIEAKFPFVNNLNLLDDNDENDEILHMTALAFHKLGALDKASEIFNLALKTNPTKATLWSDAAKVLKELGMDSIANEFVVRAKSLNSDI